MDGIVARFRWTPVAFVMLLIGAHLLVMALAAVMILAGDGRLLAAELAALAAIDPLLACAVAMLPFASKLDEAKKRVTRN